MCTGGIILSFKMLIHHCYSFPPTPQSAKFGAQFHSPPTADGSPTDFQTGWMTPQDYTFTTSFQTPGQLPDGFFMDEPSSSSSNTSMKRPRPESYQHLLPKLETKKAMPMLDHQHELNHTSFPTNSFLEQFDNGTNLDEFTYLPSDMPIQPIMVEQMPTPPTHRDPVASARRKANRMRQVMQVPVSTASGPPRRMSVPDESWSKQNEQVPVLPQSASLNMDGYQLAMPEMYDFDLTGPLTAPAHSQAPVFWDPNGSVDMSNSTMPMLTQEFTTPDQQLMMPPSAPFVFNAPPVSRAARQQSQGGFVVPSLPSHASRPSTSHSTRPNDSNALRVRASTMQSLHARKASSVDPSVLLTAGAPGSHPPATATMLRSNSVISNSSADLRQQPYQFQNDALRRERQERAERAHQMSRSGSIDRAVEQKPAAMSMSRSNSKSRKIAALPRSATSSSVDLSASMAEHGAHLPRIPSPLKQHKLSISEKVEVTSEPSKHASRPSVVLRVDSQGRAVTTAKGTDDKPLRKPRSKVAFRKDDESASESDSDDEDLPTGPARSRTNTLLTGLNRSRSLKTSPTRHDGLGRSRSLRTSPMKNEAQQALHEAVKDRRKKSMDVGRTFQISIPAGADPFVSAPSFAMPPPPLPQGQFMPVRQDSGVWNISPTAISPTTMPTPPSEFEKQFLDVTRCICNNMVPNDGQLMVQW